MHFVIRFYQANVLSRINFNVHVFFIKATWNQGYVIKLSSDNILIMR